MRRQRGALAAPGSAIGACLVAAVGAGACTAVLGIDDVEFGDRPATGSGGAGGGTGTAGSTSSGTAGTAGGGGTACEPGHQLPCYEGPPGSENEGTCHGGLTTCDPQGSAYGPCVGQVLPATEDCATTGDESCDGSGTCTGNGVWSHAFGAAGNAEGKGLAVDALGALLVTGDFDGALDFGGGALTANGTDIYAAKLTPAGGHVWSERYGDALVQNARRIAVDAAGEFAFTQSFRGSLDFGLGPLNALGQEAIYLPRLSPAGVALTAYAFGGSGTAAAHALAYAPNGDIILAGAFNGTLTFPSLPQLVSQNGSDAFLARVDASGHAAWAKNFGQGNDQLARGVGLDSNGNILVTGYFYNGIDFGCGALVANGADVFVAKFDALGTCMWSESFGGSSFQSGWDLALGPNDDVFVVGRFQGTMLVGVTALNSPGTGDYDAFIIHLGSGGAVLWAHSAGGVGTDHAQAVAVDSLGQAVVLGTFTTTLDWSLPALAGAGQGDLFVTKFDAAGNVVWSRAYGDAAVQGVVDAEDVALGPTGDIFLTASFQGTVNFGPAPLTSAGGDDVVVARLAP